MKQTLAMMFFFVSFSGAANAGMPHFATGTWYLNSVTCAESANPTPLFDDLTFEIRKIDQEFAECTGKDQTCIVFNGSFNKRSRLLNNWSSDGGSFKVRRNGDGYEVDTHGSGGGASNCKGDYCPRVGIQKILKWEDEQIVARGYSTGCEDGAVLTLNKTQPHDKTTYDIHAFPESIFGNWALESILCKSGDVSVNLGFERSLKIDKRDGFNFISDILITGKDKLGKACDGGTCSQNFRFWAFKNSADNSVFIKNVEDIAAGPYTPDKSILGGRFRVLLEVNQTHLVLAESNLTCRDLTGFGESVATYRKKLSEGSP